MHSIIARRMQALDNLLDSLYHQLKNYPDETLNRRPGPGQWSVLQVMQHLLLSEHLSEKYVRKKLSFGADIPDVDFSASWRMFLLRWINALPYFKFKAPKGVNDEALPEISNLEDVMRAWRANRQSLRELLESLPPDYARKALYKHPSAGKLSLAQMLSFFGVHFRRHQRQIQRILKR